MLTAVIAAEDDPTELAETLSPLVTAAVDGLVRRVHIITPAKPNGAMSALIDSSGADHHVVANDPLFRWRSLVDVGPKGWRLCLVAGMVPTSDWAEHVARHIAISGVGAATFRLTANVSVRLAAEASRFVGRIYPPAGLLLENAEMFNGRRVTKLRARLNDRRR